MPQVAGLKLAFARRFWSERGSIANPTLGEPLLSAQDEEAPRKMLHRSMSEDSISSSDGEGEELEFTLVGLVKSSAEQIRQTGIVEQYAADGHHPPKLLEYDSKRLTRGAGPFRALLSEARKHSILRFKNMRLELLLCVVVSALFGINGPFIESGVEEMLSSMWTVTSSGLFFILGPYMALMLTRWWDIREKCITALWDNIGQLNILAQTWFHTDSAADRAARHLVRRYGVLSHSLLCLTARGHDGPKALKELVNAGLLTAEEYKTLKPLPAKPQVVWGWMCKFWNQALTDIEAHHGGLQCTSVPGGESMVSSVLSKCMAARSAILLALTFVSTQVPFAYVHLLAMIVQFAQLVNAAWAGTHTGILLTQPLCLGNATLPSGYHRRIDLLRLQRCHPAFEVFSWYTTLIILMGWIIQVLAYPLIYNGLLSIGVALENPLGNAFMDLPTLAYQHYLHDECVAFASGIEAIDPADGWWPGLVRSSSPASRTPERSSEARSHDVSAEAAEDIALSSDEESSELTSGSKKKQFKRVGGKFAQIRPETSTESSSKAKDQAHEQAPSKIAPEVQQIAPVARSNTEPDLWRVIEQMKEDVPEDESEVSEEA